MIFNLFYNSDSVTEAIILLVCLLLAVIISLSLHEFAHAFVAHKCGDDTAKVNGRMTVNPLKHIDPIGFIMLMVVGFGFAKPVPINPYNFRKRRRDYFLVSIAGITVNIILAFISSFFWVLLYFVGNSYFLSILQAFFDFMISINLCLFVFNLIPIFPLDGFRITEAAFGRTNKFINFMRRYGQMILIGLLIWSAALSWISGYLPESAAVVLYYLDILGFLINTISGYIEAAFIWLWALLF